MEDKLAIARNWLPRYTGMPIDAFGDYVLLTNFSHYVDAFCQRFGCGVQGIGRPMQAATNSDGLTIVNFGIGSPNADGAVLVSHVNMKGGVDNAANADSQRQQLQAVHGLVGSTFLEPAAYRGGEPNRAATWGIRNDKKNEWNFYYQNHRVDGPGQYTLIGQAVIR